MKILVQRTPRHRRWAGVLLFAVVSAPLLWWEHHEASLRNASLDLEPPSFEAVARLPLPQDEPLVFGQDLPPPASIGAGCPDVALQLGAPAEPAASQTRSPC